MVKIMRRKTIYKHEIPCICGHQRTRHYVPKSPTSGWSGGMCSECDGWKFDELERLKAFDILQRHGGLSAEDEAERKQIQDKVDQQIKAKGNLNDCIFTPDNLKLLEKLEEGKSVIVPNL